MTKYTELLMRIELALSLGNEPTAEELSQNNISWNEYNILIMLNSAIENVILQERNNNCEITKENALMLSLRAFRQLLCDFDMTEDLNIVLNEKNILEGNLNGNY